MKKNIALSLLAAVLLPLGASAQTFQGKILKLDFRQGITERGGSSMGLNLSSGMSRKGSVSLLDLERALEQAAEDPKISMVLITPDRLNAGAATTEEIRASLKRFQASGKPVLSYSTAFTPASYYLASVADRVVLNASGEGQFAGSSSTMFYLKDALDTLGIEMQLIRHGKYKSAGERYILNDISPENREQNEVLLRSVWESRMEEIAASRGVSTALLDSLAGTLALDRADTWKRYGLVDEVVHRDEVEKYLSALFRKAPEDIPFVSLEKYAAKLKKGSGDRIAVVFADGEIARSGYDGIVGEKMARTLAEVRQDDGIKAVVFRVNSPGGEVLASDLIRREVELLRESGKPVVASYGNYAASGGYWISSPAGHIFADRTTLTGSIGVFGLIPAVGDAIRKNLKINPVTVKTHPHSDAMGGMRPLDEAELAYFQEHIEYTYDRFVSLVAESRDKTPEAVDEIAQGRVWSGRDALELGLVDEIGTLSDAIRYAAAEAGLKKWQIEQHPEKKSSLAALLDGPAPEPLVLLPELLGSMYGFPERPVTLARLPYLIDIR